MFEHKKTVISNGDNITRPKNEKIKSNKRMLDNKLFNVATDLGFLNPNPNLTSGIATTLPSARALLP